MRRRVASFSHAFCFSQTIEHATSNPWNGNFSCPLAQTFMDAYRHITGAEIEPVVFHAGVEAGKFQTRGYDADIINFGADTLNAHTIGESVKVSTTSTKTDVLRAFLQQFAGVEPPSPQPEPEPKPETPTGFSPWIAGVVGAVVGAAIFGIIWLALYKTMRRKMLSSMGTALL